MAYATLPVVGDLNGTNELTSTNRPAGAVGMGILLPGGGFRKLIGMANLPADAGGAVPAPSYTDAQARAAQLGRVAPAGTTTVTLTSESPRDYGTAASGTFTVDATGAVEGAGAGFRLGTSATAPLFQNAPAGQPFVYVGAPYAQGKALGYSILVQADAIQVVIYPL